MSKINFFLFTNHINITAYQSCNDTYMFDVSSDFDSISNIKKLEIDKMIEEEFLQIEDNFGGIVAATKEWLSNAGSKWIKCNNYLFTNFFSQNIEDYGTPIRQIVYLNVLKKLKAFGQEFTVRTDSKSFFILLKENGISNVELVGRELSLMKVFLASIARLLLLKIKAPRNYPQDDIQILSLGSNWNSSNYDRNFGKFDLAEYKYSYIHYLSDQSQLKKIPNGSVVLNSFLKPSSILKMLGRVLSLGFDSLKMKKICFEHESLNYGRWLSFLLFTDSFTIFLTDSFYCNTISDYAIRIRNKNKFKKLFILNYGELFAIQRKLNSDLFSKLGRFIINISFQHAVVPKAKMMHYMPKSLPLEEVPSYYFLHGANYARRVKEYYPEDKIRIVGCLKYDGIVFSNPASEKKILLAPSLNDIDTFVEIFSKLKKNSLSDFSFYISRHPIYAKEVLERKISSLQIDIQIIENVSSLEFAKSCEFVVASYSSVGIESLFYNKKFIRIYSRKLPKLFDFDSRIPTVSSTSELEELIQNYPQINRIELLNDYFGYDGESVVGKVKLNLSKIFKSNS